MRNSTVAILAGLPAGCGTNGLYWVDEKLAALSAPPNSDAWGSPARKSAMLVSPSASPPRVDSASRPLDSRAPIDEDASSPPPRMHAVSNVRTVETEPPPARLLAIPDAVARPLPTAEGSDALARTPPTRVVQPAVNLDQRKYDATPAQRTPVSLVAHERTDEPLFGVSGIGAPILSVENSTLDRSPRPMDEPSVVEAPASSTQIPKAESSRKPLRVGSIALCRSIEGFGRFTSARSPLHPGDKAIVYAELAGQEPKQTAFGWETRINGKLRLTPRAGGPTTEWAFPPVVDTAPTERSEFFVHFVLSLPGTLGEGEYRLEVAVEDVHGGQAACEETSLRVEPKSASTTGGD